MHRPTHKESGRHAQSQEQKAYKQCIPPSTENQGAMYTAQYRVVVRHTQGQTLRDMDKANHKHDDDHAQSQRQISLNSNNRQCPNTEWLAMMRRAMPRGHKLQCHTQGQIQREWETCKVLAARKQQTLRLQRRWEANSRMEHQEPRGWCKDQSREKLKPCKRLGQDTLGATHSTNHREAVSHILSQAPRA